MTQNNSSSNRVVFAGAILAGLLAGCQTDNSSMTDFFLGEENRSTQNFMTAQAAAGARSDATLQGFHFDGDKLNTLGEAKLDLMLKDDDSAEPVVVYMNLATDDANLRGRRDSVVIYLEDRGIVKDQIEFKAGTNPNQTSLAAEHMSRMLRTESDGSSSASSSDGQRTSGGTNSGN